jgi:hypothetical protein
MKHMLMSKLIVAGVALSAFGIATAADLTPAQVKSRIEAAGYTDVRDVHREGDHFDAKAVNRAGKHVLLDVDAKTGTIKPEKEGKDEAHEHSK